MHAIYSSHWPSTSHKKMPGRIDILDQVLVGCNVFPLTAISSVGEGLTIITRRPTVSKLTGQDTLVNTLRVPLLIVLVIVAVAQL